MEFKKFIHVTIENEGTEDVYMQVCSGEKAEDALTETTKTRVATYQLVEVKEGKLEPMFLTVVG